MQGCTRCMVECTLMSRYWFVGSWLHSLLAYLWWPTPHSWQKTLVVRKLPTNTPHIRVDIHTRTYTYNVHTRHTTHTSPLKTQSMYHKHAYMYTHTHGMLMTIRVQWSAPQSMACSSFTSIYTYTCTWIHTCPHPHLYTCTHTHAHEFNDINPFVGSVKYCVFNAWARVCHMWQRGMTQWRLWASRSRKCCCQSLKLDVDKEGLFW